MRNHNDPSATWEYFRVEIGKTDRGETCLYVAWHPAFVSAVFVYVVG